jgi:hypothetical protein
MYELMDEMVEGGGPYDGRWRAMMAFLGAHFDMLEEQLTTTEAAN